CTPVGDDRTSEEAFGPRVHLARDLLGRRQEHWIAPERQRQVALVVERHRAELPERVLAVEHPAVRAGKQRIRDVADALVDRHPRLGARTGSLNPLALQIGRNVAADEAAVAGILDANRGARDEAVWIE